VVDDRVSALAVSAAWSFFLRASTTQAAATAASVTTQHAMTIPINSPAGNGVNVILLSAGLGAIVGAWGAIVVIFGDAVVVCGEIVVISGDTVVVVGEMVVIWGEMVVAAGTMHTKPHDINVLAHESGSGHWNLLVALATEKVLASEAIEQIDDGTTPLKELLDRSTVVNAWREPREAERGPVNLFDCNFNVLNDVKDPITAGILPVN